MFIGPLEIASCGGRFLLAVQRRAVVVGCCLARAATAFGQAFEPLEGLSPDGNKPRHVVAQYEPVPRNRRS